MRTCRACVFRAASGNEQSYGPEQVSRVYLGTFPVAAVPGAANNNTSDLAAGLDTLARFALPRRWLGLDRDARSQGEWISFSTSGRCSCRTTATIVLAQPGPHAWRPVHLADRERRRAHRTRWQWSAVRNWRSG
jgi:hypothetical protein